MTPITTEQTDRTVDTDMRLNLIHAGIVTIAFLVLVMGILLFPVSLPLPSDQVAAGAFFVGWLVVLVIVLTGLRRGRRAAFLVVDFGQQVLNDYRESLKKPALSALPDEKAALPAPAREIPATVGGRAVEPIPLDPIFGFDPRDLRYLCRYLANGNKFTEAVMENMPLPFTPEQKLGKQEDNTPYNRFTFLCVKTEVIVGRGGPGNPSGKLMVKDPDEIYRRIKALPENTLDELKSNGQ